MSANPIPPLAPVGHGTQPRPLGPFRDDARDELSVPAASPSETMRALHASLRPALGFSGYAAAIGLTTLGVALAMQPVRLLGALLGAVLLLGGALGVLRLREAEARLDRQLGTHGHRVRLEGESLTLERPELTMTWPYAAIRRVRVVGRHVVLEVGRQVLVLSLPSSEGPPQQLAAWLRAQAPAPRRLHPWQALFALALGYAALCAAAVALARL